MRRLALPILLFTYLKLSFSLANLESRSFCINPARSLCASKIVDEIQQDAKKSELSYFNRMREVRDQNGDLDGEQIFQVFYPEHERYRENLRQSYRTHIENLADAWDETIPGSNIFLNVYGYLVLYGITSDLFFNVLLADRVNFNGPNAHVDLVSGAIYGPSLFAYPVEKFGYLIKFILFHEGTHFVDPSSYPILSERLALGLSYPLQREVAKLGATYKIGYDQQCLANYKKESEHLFNSISTDGNLTENQKYFRDLKGEIEKLLKNPYHLTRRPVFGGFEGYRFPEIDHCGNPFASEAFSDFMAIKSLVKEVGRNRYEIRKAIYQITSVMCSNGQPRLSGATDTHPSPEDRINEILFQNQDVKRAFGCQ